MTTPATLSPSDVRLVLSTYRDVLRSHQDVVNRLNVYPVPDGDTGTNMALTIESVVAGLEGIDEPLTMEGVCHAISHGSLMGARGNSGVILSQLLRGMAERFREVEAVDSINVDVSGHISHEASDVGDLRYEVMYLLDAPDEAIAAFKEVWAGIGDSIVVVGGDGIFNCHIHTDDIGASIEAAIQIGRPRDIRVTDLAEQVVEEKWVREGAFEAEGSAEPSGPPAETAVVAVVTGDGVGRIFRSLGVQRLVKGGQSMNPSTADLVEAVEATGSANVIILPNNKNIIPVAKQVDDLTSVTVSVVPTTSIVEGFASLLSYDPSSDAAGNLGSMTDSASAVIAAEVTQAVRDTEVEAGVVREGDWIGLTDKGILTIDASLVVCATHLLDTIVTDDHELVTIIEGEGSTAANTRRLSEWLGEERPDVAVEVHHGGQPLYPYLFGIE